MKLLLIEGFKAELLLQHKVLQSGTVLGPDNLFKNLVPNVWVLVAHILAAVVVVSVIIFFVWHPTKKLLQKRREFYNKNIIEVENSKKDAQQYLTDAKSEKLKTEKIIKNLISKSQKEADQIKQTAEFKATSKAREIYDKAVNDANKLKQNAQTKIHENVADLAIDIACKIIGENANNELNRKLVDEYLDASDN